MFTDDYSNLNAGPIAAAAYTTGGRVLSVDTGNSAIGYPYGAWPLGLLTRAAGRKYVLVAKLKHAAGPGTQRAFPYFSAFNAAGAYISDVPSSTGSYLLTGNVDTVEFGLDMDTVPANVVSIRPGVLLNRLPNGEPTTGRVDVFALYVRDITESVNAGGSAAASASSAAAALASKQGAAESASAASTSATNAATSAGNASTSAGQASTSATNAAGSASAAASSSGVAATAASAAAAAMALTFPQVMSPGMVTADFSGFTTTPLPAAAFTSDGRTLIRDTGNAAIPYPYGAFTQALLSIVPNRRYELVAKLKHAAGPGTQIAFPYFHAFDAAGNSLGSVSGTGNPFGLTGGVDVATWGLNTATLSANVAFVRAGVLVNRTTGSEPTTGRVEVSALYLRDVTESSSAAGSATAAAGSASNAAASRQGAEQAASAASTSSTNAATSAGQASTSATNASTSATNAGTAAAAAEASKNTAVTASVNAAQVVSDTFPQVPSANSLTSDYSNANALGLPAVQWDAAARMALIDTSVPGPYQYGVWTRGMLRPGPRKIRVKGRLRHLAGAAANYVFLYVVYFNAAGATVGGATSGSQLIATTADMDVEYLVDMSSAPASATLARFGLLVNRTAGGDTVQGRVGVSQLYVEDVTATKALEASVQTVANAQAATDGRTQAYWAVSANAGGTSAAIEARAVSNPDGSTSSRVGIVAEQFEVTSTSAGVRRRVLRILGNEALVEGNLSSTAGVFLGSGAKWRYQLETRTFPVTDGQAVAFGVDLGKVPSIDFSTVGLAALASGETYRLYAESLSATGFTARLRIVTPGTSSSYNINASTTPGTGPTRQIARGGNPEANNGTYTVTVGGTYTGYAYNNDGQLR